MASSSAQGSVDLILSQGKIQRHKHYEVSASLTGFSLSQSQYLVVVVFKLQMTTETAKKKGTPQILKTDAALLLAEKWVANMTRPAQDDPIETEPEVRPHRLGLGAKVSRQTKRRSSDDPLDQKLQAKFDAGRRNYATSVAESAGSTKNTGDDSEDDDDSESKSQAFGKKKKNTSAPH